ncbi:MAG: VIT1/CCC1 transporter family protein [Chlamydiales bacterium]|nr:VIT1/CCC1 transporter family protein [Chlamydiales bacterium]
MREHFEGKTVAEHVLSARLKGLEASREMHGTELPGHYSAAADAGKETTFLLVGWLALFGEWKIEWLGALMIGWLVWKVGRSAILGWSRLERLHRLIEEERWEIEHHRGQEKEELKEMYAAKGFEGKLLEEVTDVLMADDNRLLQVMLEEELGLHLESYEHPLKQACGAGVGVLIAIFLVGGSERLFGVGGAIAAGVFVIAFSAGISAKLEKNRKAVSIIWNTALGALAVAITYFTAQIIGP